MIGSVIRRIQMQKDKDSKTTAMSVDRKFNEFHVFVDKTVSSTITSVMLNPERVDTSQQYDERGTKN